MNIQQTWRKPAAFAGAFLLSSLGFTTSALGITPNSQSSTAQATPLSEQRQFLLAQASSCRQVLARNGLYVRREPSVYSATVGIIDYNRNVTLENLGSNGWVPISAPLVGYVYANYLGVCDTASAPPPSNCRRVTSATGTYVWQTPSNTGANMGLVENGRRVTIENLGSNGWVPITVPMQGYVPAENLAYCG